MAALLKAADIGAQKRVSVFVAGQSVAVKQPYPAPDVEADAAVGADADVGASLEYVPAAIAAIDFEESEIADLRAQLEQAKTQFDALEVEAEKSAAAAYQRGLEEGKAQAQSLEQERIALLASAMKQGHAALGAHLERLEQFSLKIGGAAVEKIIGKSDERQALMQQMIRHHCATLSTDMVVRIRVSRDDFPSEAMRADMSHTLGGVEVVTDPALHTGQCLFDLKLGRYDASIDLQWDRLQQLLDDLMAGAPLP